MNSDNPFDPADNAPDELPDFLRLQKMAPTRMNLLEWRQNGFEQRLGDLEARSAWFPIAGGNDNAELAESIVDSCSNVRDENLESRLNAIEWWAGISYFHDECGKLVIPNSLQARLARMNGFEARLVALETWTDINSTAPDCIHNLIAEGMTGVTADMHEHLERLTRRIDDLQDLLLKAVLKVDALESKTPC